MNKQDIFPLYVGKCKVRCFSQNLINQYAVGVCHGIVRNDVFMYDEDRHKDFTFELSDCQLILKRISDMSEREKSDCRKLMLLGQLDKYDCIPKGIFDYNQYRYYHTPKSFLYLVQNGYAIDDEWFTNGIALEAGK